MNDLPDAPWIVDAEQNGYPVNDPVRCPICGSDHCDYIFLDRDGEVVGCEDCLKRIEPWELEEANGGDEE